VSVRMGPDHAITDAAGRSSLPEGVRDEIFLDAARLPTGFIAPPFRAASTGRMQIAVVQVARLVIHIVQAADSAAAQEGGGLPAAGLHLSPVDAAGRARAALSGEDGTVTFRSLAPCEYRI